jgi:peptide/nickel transport system substrate-binding protein
MFRRLRWQILIALSGSLIVLALAGVLAAGTTATTPPFYQKAYVEGVVGVPQQLNPLLQAPGGPQSERDLAALLFDGLTRPGADGAPRPDLAERWLIDTTGKVYTFTLRAGLRWHDGTPLTADDVLFTVQGVQKIGFAGDRAISEPWRGVLAERIDAQRIRFTLPAPFAPFLAATKLPILPAHLLGNLPPDQWAKAAWSRKPIGSGLFRLRSIDDIQATLVPFEGAARGRPKLDLMVLRFFPSTEAAREALRRKEIQGVATVASAGTEMHEVAQHVRGYGVPLGEYTMLTFNLRTPPLDDLGFRTALARGLDRTELIRRVLGGQGQALDTPIAPQSWAHGGAALPAADAKAAADTLDALGWTRGANGFRERAQHTLSLPLFCAQTPAQLALAKEIARQWGMLGIDVPVYPLSREELRDRVQRRDFTLLLGEQVIGSDPDGFARWHSSQARNSANDAGLADTTSDRLLVEGRTTTDQDERARIYQAWEERWTEIIPSLPLLQPVLVYELDQDVRPAGLEPKSLLPTPADRFRMIGDWTAAEIP